MGERNSGSEVFSSKTACQYITYIHRSIQLKTGHHAFPIPCSRSWLTSFKSDMMERLIAMATHTKKKGFW
jgi:beta-lactamase regulating signal transducer with metallopeptidase domain